MRICLVPLSSVREICRSIFLRAVDRPTFRLQLPAGKPKYSGKRSKTSHRETEKREIEHKANLVQSLFIDDSG